MARRQDKDSLNAQEINNLLFTGKGEATYEGSDIENAPYEEENSSDSSDEAHYGQVIPQPTPQLVPRSAQPGPRRLSAHSGGEQVVSPPSGPSQRGPSRFEHQVLASHSAMPRRPASLSRKRPRKVPA